MEIKAALARAKSIQSSGTDKKVAPDFFKTLKEKFVTQLLGMGYEYDKIDDYLEDVGLCELRQDLVVETIDNRNFVNKLYTKKDEEEEKGMDIGAGQYQSNFSYDFHDPSGLGGPGLAMPPVGKPLIMKHNSVPYEEGKTCAICLNSNINTVCVPCGHRCICIGCSKTLKE